MDLNTITIDSLQKKLSAGEVKAVELCRTALDRIESLGELNAFITVTAESALARAAEIDRAVERGEQLPVLSGVVVAVKDNMVIRDVRTTAGSRILYNYKPPYTATAIRRLEEAGALIIGKTNCD